jgi:prepilin peptidase CpaA|tara:strand:+ start:364 stop:1296 length:933 start_codon:yes stop_codon:yes gene_type:complete
MGLQDIVNFIMLLYLKLFMVYTLILLGLVLIGLVVGSVTDLKTREVPDWLSYGMMGTGVGLSLLFSVLYWDYSFVAHSLFGLLVMFLFGLLMFYSGQWGGGDSKILMGVGALVGLSWNLVPFPFPFPFLLAFFVNMLLMGAVYGIGWSVYLVVRHYSAFKASFRHIMGLKAVGQVKLMLLVTGFVVLASYFFVDRWLWFVVLGGYIVVVLISYLRVAVKALEKSSMIRSVRPDQLTEGDWIVKDVSYRGKYICGPKDLGIEKKAIKKLVALYKAGKIKEIVIKEGIPFVPSFLLAFILTLFVGNFFFLFI